MSTPEKKTSGSMRLDKWLWCARFFRTRSLAATAIRTGKVKIDGAKVKPAHTIRPDEQLNIRCGPFEYEVRVTALAKTRGSAAAAQLLYSESRESTTKRLALAEQRRMTAASQPRPATRPDKKARRRIIRFTRQSD